MKYLLTVIVALCLWCGCCQELVYASPPAPTQTWDWSPRAAHHTAVCKVQSGNSGGSGTYIQYGELRGVVTAAHVTEGQKTSVTWSDGTVAIGASTVDKNWKNTNIKYDVSFVFVTHPTIKPIPLATQKPSVGQAVEFVTYGGPERRLRHFWATIESLNNDITHYKCDVISGDSGGGVFNLEHEFIGIEVFGRSESIRKDWSTFHGGGGITYQLMCDFFDRIIDKFKGKYPLPPPHKAPGRGDPQPPFYPPPGPAPVHPFDPPPIPELVPPGSTPSPSIDDLIDMILEKLEEMDLQGADGKDGKDGADGEDGADGTNGVDGVSEPPDLDDLADRIKKKISGSIRVTIQPI